MPQANKKLVVWVVLGTIAALIAGVLIGLAVYSTTTITIVPKNIAHVVNFPVYYPNPGKLPTGYRLDTNSFTNPVKNGVAYTVNYDGNKKVVFSVQPKPSDNELLTFNNNYIPLRVDYKTLLGQAEIGAYHGQTLASLPITDGPWMVITAPSDINQNDLKQVLKAIRKP